MMVPVITSNWSYSPSSLFLRLESCSWLRGTVHKCCWFSFNPIYWHLHGAQCSSDSFYLGFNMYYYVQPGPSIMLFCYASCMAPCVHYLKVRQCQNEFMKLSFFSQNTNKKLPGFLLCVAQCSKPVVTCQQKLKEAYHWTFL